jgi:hypothetical protein
MICKHDQDSLEALKARLAWSDAKHLAKRWSLVLPVCGAIAIWFSLGTESHQFSKPRVVGPWMLKVDKT